MEKLFTWTFWIIAAVHVIAFAGIGLATGSWRMMWFFLAGFAVVFAVVAGVKIHLARKNKTKNEE